MDLSDYEDIPLRRRPVNCSVPLTGRQLEVWNVDMTKRREGWRRCAASLRILGPLSIPILSESIGAIISRHESLRTKFVVLDAVPVQQIDTPGPYDLTVLDLRGVASGKVEAEARRLAQAFAHKKVGFEAGSLCDVQVLRLSAREHVLVLMLDHMISDAISWEIVVREIWTLYCQAAQGREFSLPDLPVQFADYSVWQQQIYGRWLERHEAYWRNHLAGVQPLRIPLDRPSSRIEHPPTQMLQFSLGEDISIRLRDLSKRKRIRPALVVMTLYVAAMARWCDRQDVLFTMAGHGRYCRQVKGMVGYLATVPHLRVEVPKGQSTRDLLERVVEEFHCSYHQHWDFDRVAHLIPQSATDLNFNWIPTTATYRFLSTNWIYNVMNLSEELRGCERELTDMLDIRPFPLPTLWWHKFMSFFFDNGGTNIYLAIAHQPEFIATSTVQRFVEDLRFFSADLLQGT